jgi:hypothetical protein
VFAQVAKQAQGGRSAAKVRGSEKIRRFRSWADDTDYAVRPESKPETAKSDGPREVGRHDTNCGLHFISKKEMGQYAVAMKRRPQAYRFAEPEARR